MKKTIKRIFAVVLAMAICLAIMPVTFAAGCRGDVDGSGRTNSGDALLILRKVVGYTDSEFNAYRADLNNDGTINSSDALRVLQIAVGLDDPTTYSKNEIIKFYSDALDSAATGDVEIFYQTWYQSKMVNDNDSTDYVDFDESSVLEDVFHDGYSELGWDLYEFCPNANIDPSLVESARIENRNGLYYVFITLVADTADDEEYIPRNIYPYTLNYADCTVSGLDDYYVTDATASFPASEIMAIIADGELSEIMVTIPFEMHMNLRAYEGSSTLRVTEKGEVTDVYTFM